MDVPQARATGFEELSVEGYEPAIVLHRAAGPKLVVTHGAGGQASLHCEHWRQLLSDQVTLICPRGKRRFQRDPGRGYYYPDHLALASEVSAAITAFEQRFEPLETGERYVYVGYSQGATMGALAFASEGAKFSHLVLVEGGYADFSRPLALRFKQSGGQGVLFVCGTKRCHEQARANVYQLRQIALKAEWRWAQGAGHRPDGPVAREVVDGLGLLFADEPRWKGAKLAFPSVRFE